MDNKRTGEGGDTLLYNIYRAGRTHPDPPWEGGRGKRGNGKRKTKNGELTDPLRALRSSPCLRGTKKTGNGKREEFL